jgi:hypothetical protein
MAANDGALPRNLDFHLHMQTFTQSRIWGFAGKFCNENGSVFRKPNRRSKGINHLDY